MKQYVYPAVVYENDDKILIGYPDLDIYTEGNTIEESFLFAKEYLKVFLTTAIKHDMDFNLPTKFEKTVDKFKSAKYCLLIDTFV